jgi:predicted nucleic-acid-binding Zn-ribbon protein
MMEITANAIQTVNANQNVLFTDVVTCGNCSMTHRDGSGLVTLRGVTNQCRARYKVSFGGNIAIPTGGTVGEISVAIAVDGEPLLATQMIVTPAAVENLFNVSAQTYIDVPCNCCVTVAVENTSTQAIEVQNANLIVVRTA